MINALLKLIFIYFGTCLYVARYQYQYQCNGTFDLSTEFTVIYFVSCSTIYYCLVATFYMIDCIIEDLLLKRKPFESDKIIDFIFAT